MINSARRPPRLGVLTACPLLGMGENGPPASSSLIITSSLVLLSSVFAVIIAIGLEALGWGAVVSRGGRVISCASSSLILCEREGDGSLG